jgi:hypothetical protein
MAKIFVTTRTSKRGITSPGPNFPFSGTTHANRRIALENPDSNLA